MFGLFKKKAKVVKPQVGIRFVLQGEEFICIGVNGVVLKHAISDIYSRDGRYVCPVRNELTGRTVNVNPRWVAMYENIKYYEDGTWEVI